MKIIKRNGDKVPFDPSRIERAILKAFEQLSMNTADVKGLVDKIQTKVKDNMSVEEIQDIVVKMLMGSKFKDVALAYQNYRVIRTAYRDKEKNFNKKIEGLIKCEDKDILNENTNKASETIPVQRDLLAGITSRDYYLNHILPKKLKEAHEQGRIYLHDLDYLLFKEGNCGVYDIATMLRGGCKIGNATMSEPNSVEVAVGHAIQIVASISSNTFGGCTIPYFDKIFIPYIRKSFIKHFKTGLIYIEGINEDATKNILNISKEQYFLDDQTWKCIYEKLAEGYPRVHKYALDLTENSVKQAVQSFEYEINSLSTVNGQSPFTTIGIGTETSWEGRLVQEYVFKTRMEGFGAKKEVAIFPKIVFAVCDQINFDTTSPNHDIMLLGAECMTKSVYPDIMFVSLEQVQKEEVLYPMGCRAFLSDWKDTSGHNVVVGRGNLGATSINLPRIAIKHQGDEDGFYKELDEVLELCKENSVFRINYMDNLSSNIAPIIWQQGALASLKKDETVSDILKNGFMTISIGYIGLSEVSELLYGKNFAYDKNSYEKSIKIMEHIKAKTLQFKEETGYGFALYSTPSESLCMKFEALDIKEFGIIKGVTDKGYYDNSFHVSSRISINPFMKLKLEAPFHTIASGGHISYIESDSLKNNVGAVLDILRYGQSVGIHYMGINQPVDTCHLCGFKGEFAIDEHGFHCAQCGNRDPETINVIRRVCGYLAQPNDRPFNVGKQLEVINRVIHFNGKNVKEV